MTRTTAKYLALLALATILFNWKTLLTNQFTTIVGSEAVDQTYGWLHFWVNSIWHRHAPLWDPYEFGGRPFAGEMQTAAYYPVRLLFALMPLNRNGMVSPRFYHEYLAFARFLGACFMFGLLREFRRSHLDAFIGACAFSMGGLAGQTAMAALHGKLHLDSGSLPFPAARTTGGRARPRFGGSRTRRRLHRNVDPDRRRAVFHDAGHRGGHRGCLLRRGPSAASFGPRPFLLGWPRGHRRGNSCGGRWHWRAAIVHGERIQPPQSALDHRRLVPHGGQNSL